jgi:hypothetical protein
MISIHDEVEKVVVEMTKNRRLFTAHDVTKVVRHNVDGDKVFHNDVKHEVHTLYEDDEMGLFYTRTQINLGGNVSPFVYHLTHQDPDTDYNKDWVNTTLQLSKNLNVNPVSGNSQSNIKRVNTIPKSVKPVAVKIGSAIVVKPVTVTKDGEYHISDDALKAASNAAYSFDSGYVTKTVTKEGRLTVPKDMLKNIHSANLYFEKDKANVNGKHFNSLVISSRNNNPLKTYKQNKDGRLRISDKFLSKLNSNGSYKIKQFGSRILIIAG